MMPNYNKHLPAMQHQINQRSVIVSLPILHSSGLSPLSPYDRLSPNSLPVDLSHSTNHSPEISGQHPAYPHLPITPPAEHDNPFSLYSDLKHKRKAFPVPSEYKDDAYWERRRRNNESAKRSREIRKQKEMQTTNRIQYLEQENVKLQTEVSFLREEIERLRQAERLPYIFHHKTSNAAIE